MNKDETEIKVVTNDKALKRKWKKLRKLERRVSEVLFGSANLDGFEPVSSPHDTVVAIENVLSWAGGDTTELDFCVDAKGRHRVLLLESDVGRYEGDAKSMPKALARAIVKWGRAGGGHGL